MQRIASAALALAAVTVVASSPLSAQFFVQGSVTFPTGDFGDSFKAGWMANAGILAWKTQNGRFNLWGEGFYGQNKLDADSDLKNIFYGGYASGSYDLTTSGSTPYLIGSIGYMVAKASGNNYSGNSEGGLSYGGGAGIDIGSNLYLEGRYMTVSIDDTRLSFLMAGAGLVF